MSLDLLESRRRFDRVQVEAIRGVEVRSFATPGDLAAGKMLPPGAAAASAFRITFRQPTLVGPDKWADNTTVSISTQVPNYPFEEPAVSAVSTPFPWSPHWHPTTGRFCIGPFWGIAKQDTLLSQLVVHIARLLNWDEQLEKGYAGWNAAAVAKYWARGGKPLRTDVNYPAIPAQVVECGARRAFAYTVSD